MEAFYTFNDTQNGGSQDSDNSAIQLVNRWANNGMLSENQEEFKDRDGLWLIGRHV